MNPEVAMLEVAHLDQIMACPVSCAEPARGRKTYNR